MHHIIQPGLDYIEAHLKTTITADELAAMAHYSTWHYCRLFAAVMGSSVSAYILRRRLDHALAEIAAGRKAIDMVLEYGFDTYAGFYKAFVKAYGCSPKKYLSIYRFHQPEKPEVTKMYTKKQLRLILSNWDIDRTLPITNVMYGDEPARNVWQVGETYYLKTGDRGHLRNNLSLVQALGAQGVPTALPIPTRAGSAFLDGEEIFILTRTIPGEPLDAAVRMGEQRYDYGLKYGAAVARLHRALRSVQPELTLDEVDLYRHVADWALPLVRQQNLQWGMGIPEALFDEWLTQLGALSAQLPRQVIHRDPNPCNILFADGEVSGFIDFDLSEINLRLWDVLYCATGILCEGECPDDPHWFDVLAGIWRGYDAEEPLTEAERQAAFYVLCAIQFICVAWFGIHDEFEALAKTNREMLRFIVQNRARIERIFLGK